MKPIILSSNAILLVSIKTEKRGTIVYYLERLLQAGSGKQLNNKL